MAALEAFHSFLNNRFTSIAGDILQFVQTILLEQQDEIKRTKEENRNLRSMLAEASANKGDSGTGNQNSDYEPHDTSLIRVKLELSTLEPDDDEEAELLPEAPTRLNPSPKKIDAEKVTRTFPAITKDNEGLQMNSYLTINLVPCDAQRTPDNLNSNAMKNESRSGGCERGTKEGTEDHYCPYCKESFKESSLLASHLVIHEGVPIPFYCQICGRHFKNRVTLKNHMIVHQKLRRFRCHFCGKGFHQKGHLKEHERIHTGEKPYGCSICGKRFTQFNHVRVHVRNHHQDISEPLEKPQNKR
uniref:C2H2-type domain-containing protein n=1 Tax=Electrophorus electricus TaxID=8005 RepID=A0AAY5F452_ELEEL